MKMQKRFFVFDYVILTCAIVLMAAGVIAIYSSSYDATGTYKSNLHLKQIFFAIFGILFMLSMIFVNYVQLSEHRLIIYTFSVFILLLVLIPGIGKQVHGSRSWLGLGGLGIQPSEFVKIAIIIVLAGYLDSVGDEIVKLGVFLKALILPAIPMALILIQPDFGTFLVYVPITLAMLFVSGCKPRYLIGLIAIGVLGLAVPMFLEYSRISNATDSVFFVFFSSRAYIFYLAALSLFLCAILTIVNLYMTNKTLDLLAYSFFIVFLSMMAAIVLDIMLKDYQRHRLLVFLNPNLFRLSSGYNVIQALIAIGSGGLTGKGFLQGSQTQLNFIPQQVNDFIFSNLGEEWGFRGSIVVLGAFFVIIQRALTIAYQAKDRLGVLIVTGVVAMLLFHVLVNAGMVLGIMPITGIPLPFISAGGSSLLSSCAAVGLLFSVEVRRFVHRD